MSRGIVQQSRGGSRRREQETALDCRGYITAEAERSFAYASSDRVCARISTSSLSASRPRSALVRRIV